LCASESTKEKKKRRKKKGNKTRQMSIEAPGLEAGPIEVAEWLELTALTRQNSSSSEADVRSIVLGASDDIAAFEDIAELDEDAEESIQEVFDELDSRRLWSGGGYPFGVEQPGNILRVIEPEIPDHHLAYVFSLLLSYCKKLDLATRKNVPGIAELEDLFQICGTVAATGFIDGSSVSFGFPRLGGQPFYDKLWDVNQALGEGMAHRIWRLGASPNPADAGVDVIAWRSCPDGQPGQLYLLGQCASGKNWDSKTPIQDYLHFHNTYWLKHPYSPVISATFIPFDFRSDVGQSNYQSLDDAYKWTRWDRTFEFGIIIDRYRLANFFAKGLAISRLSGFSVEGAGAVSQIRDWCLPVLEYIRQLGD
jgi:hypothetical protein